MKKNPNSLKIISYVLPYLWPKDSSWIKIRVIVSLLLLILAKVVGVLTPFLYKEAVDILANDINEPSLIFGLGAISLTIIYALTRLMNVGFQQLRDAVFAQVGQRALRLLGLKTFAHLHKLSLSYHLARKTGALSRVVERGIKGVEFLLRFLLFSIGPLFLELLMTSIILYIVFDIWFLVIVLTTIILYIVFTFKVTEWRVRVRKIMNEQDMEANQKAIDSLLNYETVKYFSAENREIERYNSSMKKYEKASLKTLYSLAFLNFGQSVLINFGLMALMVLAAIGVQEGSMTVGEFVMVNAYMLQITMPLNFLGTIYREIRQAIVDMSEMFHLLEHQIEVLDHSNAKDLVITRGIIEFRNVTFHYDRERKILDNVSFCVERGKILGIVGQSGSGKSTIGRLLFRFYDLTGGSILIDGQNISEVTQRSLRSEVGIVPQDIVLFNDSIFYNIAYGKLHATIKEVKHVAKLVNLHDFITGLPHGYNTSVGERGLKLSGGEKQRIGIARTLLKNPSLMILDEATSALDSLTEKEVQHSFSAYGLEKTTIIIAHRLSTIAQADIIIVLDDGVIVEKGSHSQLIALNGMYASMWHKQSRENLKAV
jgi:ATP-binding cassette subfamily B protein